MYSSIDMATIAQSHQKIAIKALSYIKNENLWNDTCIYNKQSIFYYIYIIKIIGRTRTLETQQ